MKPRPAVPEALQVILSSAGTSGDVNPFIGLGIELLARGHSVTFLTNDYYADRVRNAGIEFASDGTIEQQDFVYGPERKWPPTIEDWDEMQMRYQCANIPSSCEYVRKRHASNPSGLVVISTIFMDGARFAAEYLDIPCITLALNPSPIPTLELPYESLPSSPIAIFLGRKLRLMHFHLSDKMAYLLPPKTGGLRFVKFLHKFRKELRLPYKTFYAYNKWAHKSPYICLFPEWFGMRPFDWPKSLKFVGFPLADPANAASREKIDRFIAQHGKPLIITNGTGNQDVALFFSEVFKGCRQLDIPVIFTGAKQAFSTLPEWDRCIYEDFIDFAYVLPKCKAIVHHGGMGTIAQATRAGIPQIVRPVMFDQPDNALRVKALKLGECIFPTDFTAQSLIDAIDRVVHSPEHVAAIAKYRQDVLESTAIADACDLIEQSLSIKPRRVELKCA